MCEPATVARDRFGTPIRVKDLDSGKQCSRVGRGTGSVNNLGSEDVMHRIEGDAVCLSYRPVGTLPNGISINPEGIFIIPGNDNFCGDRVWSAEMLKVVAEIANGVGWYCSSIFVPNPVGIAEV
jgi:hypothetical protein